MWSIEQRDLELKYNWKLSRNETLFKSNLFVNLKNQYGSFLGEIAPNIRYDETPELIITQFNTLLSKGLNNVYDIIDYEYIINNESICKSLKCGLNNAILNFKLKINETSFSDYYKIKPVKNTSTSYTIPVMLPENIHSFISDNNLVRFSKLKLKVNSEIGFDLVKQVSKFYSGPLIIDANEAWNDVENHIIFLEKLNKSNILFIEQPMPETNTDEYIYLKRYAPYPIFADESIKDNVDLSDINKQFHGINIKLMKTGGCTTAIKLIESANKFNLKTMIGCMVETTLGISQAMNLCTLVDYVDLDGFMLIKDEPFGLVKEGKGILYCN